MLVVTVTISLRPTLIVNVALLLPVLLLLLLLLLYDTAASWKQANRAERDEVCECVRVGGWVRGKHKCPQCV
jgi:hypothetical protein